MGVWGWAALALWGVVGFTLVGASHLELRRRETSSPTAQRDSLEARNGAIVTAGAFAVAAGIATALAVIL